MTTGELASTADGDVLFSLVYFILCILSGPRITMIQDSEGAVEGSSKQQPAFVNNTLFLFANCPTIMSFFCNQEPKGLVNRLVCLSVSLKLPLECVKELFPFAVAISVLLFLGFVR